jgi:hypothetical protein
VRKLISLIVIASMVLVVGSAQASPRSVLKGAVTCSTQPDGIRFCGSLIVDNVPTPVRTLATSWDGTAVDVNFALPKASATHHGPYPLVMLFHGYGGSKFGLGTGGGGIGSAISSMRPWLRAGYATFSMSDRGFGESCGTAASRASIPARECAHGYNHLLDTRYEVRDAQYFAGELADQGLVSPTRIAAIGGSYGGGMSMALAALKNRVMLPNGRLVPWRSPSGRRMSIAAATPFIPWTDLAASLVPNGSTLDYVANAPYLGRYGVMKDSYVNALYAAGCNTPTTFCTTTNPDWDLGLWRQRLNQGEPYTGSLVHRILAQTTTYHSSYYIDHSEPPAPLLIANGWTDDLFPADEALRYYNRTETQYPNTPISLFFGDWGHPRAQNKAADTVRYVAAVQRWLSYYVKGQGHKPFQGVQALTETCPTSASSAGPYREPAASDDPARRRQPDDRRDPQSDRGRCLCHGIWRDPERHGNLPTGGQARLHDDRCRDRDRRRQATGRQLPGCCATARRGAQRSGNADQPWTVAPAGLARAGTPGVPAAPRWLAICPRPYGQARTAAQRRAVRQGIQRSTGRDGVAPPAPSSDRRSPRRCGRAGQAAVGQGPATGLRACA